MLWKSANSQDLEEYDYAGFSLVAESRFSKPAAVQDHGLAKTDSQF